ncbi:MAG: ABC transporter substrate-binding protein [Lachnospiraceae bacterium]|nr:ABC transporter substrate-binding protein [Lachnospiraceae bacterium]
MKKIKTLVLFCLLALTTVLCACTDDKAKNSGSITIGIAQDIDDSLDPHKMVAAGTKEIFFNVFEGLVKPDSNGNIVPAVAESVEVSEDKLCYTFKLRNGIKFHDGNAVTIEDLEYSINKFAGRDGGEPVSSAFLNVSEVNVISDDTIEIRLASADPAFLSYLASVEAAIIPKSNATPDTVCIGTGPYKYVSRSPLQNVVFERFDEYWGEGGDIKNVTFKICTNADTIAMELEGGTIDMCIHLTKGQKMQLDKENFTIYEGTMNLVQALYLNHSFEPFNDVNVRQAMNYVCDAQEVMDYVSDGAGSKIGTSIYPSFGKYFDESLTSVYDVNVDKAKELMAKSAYPDGFDMTITVPSNYEQHVDTALVLKNQLALIGINASIEKVDWDTWINDVYLGRNYESTVIGVDAANLSANALLSRFTSEAGDNFTNYNNPAYDEAFNNAVNATDDETATKYFKECAEILNSDAANVYIQDLPDFVAINKKFEGYSFYPLYVLDLTKIKTVK